MCLARTMWLCLLRALLLSPLAEAARKAPDVALPDYSIYHSEAGVMEEVQKIVDATPNMSMDLVSHSGQNYSAEVPIVTVTPPHQVDGEVLRVLVDFGEHAREFISADTGLHFLKLLAKKELLKSQFDDFKAQADDASDTAELLEVLDCCVELKVVPMENREGRKRIERTGDLCERKNGNGVDPNRNWEVDWGVREKDYTPYEEHAGAHSFSEPETYILRNLVHEFKPHVWVNVHSGMDGLFMPYDHVAHVPDDPSTTHTLKILETINAQACGGKCVVGSGGKSVGYLAHGTATDYMYEKANVSIAMTWEIYGDFKAHVNDCFRMFNPLTREGYDSIVTAWTNALFILLLQVQGHPDVAHLTFQPPLQAVATQQSVARASETVPETHTTQLPVAGQPAALNPALRWGIADGRVLQQDQASWITLVGCMFIMSVALWFASRMILRRRKRLAKAGGRRESR